MNERTWITELNAALIAIFGILKAVGMNVPPELIAPVIALFNVLLRIVVKKGWI